MDKKSVKYVTWLKSLVLASLLGMVYPSVSVAQEVTLNMEATDIREFIEMASRITGKNFIVDNGVRGTVTFVPGRGLDPGEFYDTFLSILQVQGFEAIETGNVVKILPIGKARQTQIAPIVTDQFQEEAGTLDETITQVFNLQYIPVQTAFGTLQNLAGQGETRIQPNLSSNSVIITGRRQNVARLAQVLQDIDRPNNQQVELVTLQHSVATRLAQTLRELMTGGAASPEGGPLPTQVRVSVDERTNSILLAGERADIDRMRAMITRLDIPRTQPVDTQVIPLRYAVASQLLQTLNALKVTGTGENAGANQVRIAADERTNSILIAGDSSQREPIVAAIARLDVARDQSGGTRVVPLRYAKAEELVKVLSDTSRGIQQQTAGTAAAAGATASAGADINIQADKGTNSIIITAPQHIQENLLKVVYQLDRRRAQVMIEAIIAEVSTDMNSRLGFGIANRPNGSGIVGASNFGGLNTILNFAAGGVSSIPTGLLFGVANNNFTAVLDALRGDGATNILSTPTIVTMDNEQAEIIVGQNVPFITGSYTAGGTGTTQNPFQTIQRQDVGLKLKVTPQINRSNTIQMKIEQEVSSIASSSVASDVITNKRSINTNVMVEDGQILVLGGLIQDNFNDSESRVPVLSDIPVIGNAFKQTNTTKTKQNLMAFIHPVILPDRESADAYTRNKYHTLQRQQQESQVLQRGGSGGTAAVFPNIECIDGACSRGSADDLHFNAGVQQRRPVQATPPVQRINQQAQQPVQQQAPAQAQQRPAHQRSFWNSGPSSLGMGGENGQDCVPGFCQLYDK